MKLKLMVLAVALTLGGCVLRSGPATGDGAHSGNVSGMNVNVYRTDQATYPRIIRNPFSMPVVVTVDDRPVGWLAAFSYTYLRLPAGEFVVGFTTMQGFPLDRGVIAFGPSASPHPRRSE